MKLFILGLYCVLNLYYGMARVIPDRIPPPCSKSVSNYNDCMLKYLRTLKGHMLNGIRELKIPSMNPFVLPAFSINRTLSDTMTISANVKDVKFWGFDNLEFKDAKFDPNTLKGEVSIYLPKAKVTLKYNGAGTMLSPVPMEDSGRLKGNFTDINGHGIFKLKTIDKSGVKYLAVEDLKVSGDVGGAYLKLISDKQENQSAADFISSFFNEDPKRALDTAGPLVYETVEMIGKLLMEQVLSIVPANELIPE